MEVNSSSVDMRSPVGYYLYIILCSFCGKRPVSYLVEFLKLVWHQQILVSVHLQIYLPVSEERIKVPHIKVITWWLTSSF